MPRSYPPLTNLSFDGYNIQHKIPTQNRPLYVYTIDTSKIRQQHEASKSLIVNDKASYQIKEPGLREREREERGTQRRLLLSGQHSQEEKNTSLLPERKQKNFTDLTECTATELTVRMKHTVTQNQTNYL